MPQLLAVGGSLASGVDEKELIEAAGSASCARCNTEQPEIQRRFGEPSPIVRGHAMKTAQCRASRAMTDRSLQGSVAQTRCRRQDHQGPRLPKAALHLYLSKLRT